MSREFPEKDRKTERISSSKNEEEKTFIPDSVTQFEPDSSPRQGDDAKKVVKRPVLITLDGRRVSERFVLSKEKCLIGRDVQADIKIADGEVSRLHCIFHWTNFQNAGVDEPRCRIQDNNSTNGTFLNNAPLDQTARTLHDGDMIRIGKTILGFFLKDERVLELDQLLLNMALHDSLTGLFKREYFFSELHREFERSRRHNRPLSVALLDIDHFKNVNDEHGHLRGDDVLRRFADMMRLSFREGDICGRYGGEEFAVVLPETDLIGALNAVERFRQQIAEAEMSVGSGITIRITCSGGVCTLAPHHVDKMGMLDEADQALYRAKHEGRNRTAKAGPQPGDTGTQTKPRESR